MTSAEIFHIRIVTADYYMEKPKPGLDLCFSEFRAKEIKKVPIIRIFGSTDKGVKTCMHVHGIFPYLYIPFNKKTFDTLDKSGYLIASSLDKAINISLGQSNSGSQHVFKIQLVKGIPFYGYHANEHQYLKIYMLNPRFIKRAANLLQNGAIMGKIFHTHESHVPYMLQFFMDYNLYGMSFLHVPKEVLKFRRNSEEHNIPYDIPKNQILDCNIATKQSTSKLEVDIIACFILNRFQLENKTSTHANPGIESIWQDEKVRRQNLCKELKTIPPLVVPPSQQRPDVKPTKSDDFYRVGLLNKLEQLEKTLDETTNEKIEPIKILDTEKKKTFNLTKLLTNAVYPEECTQDDLLMNASFIANHFSNGSVLESSIEFPKFPSNEESENIFMDDTIVDEDLVRSLTQLETANKTLREEDMDLLDVMQELEDRQCENNIDLDSTLAPLSQNNKLNNSQHVIWPKLSSNESSDDESDTECHNDFTMVMDELLIQISQSTLPDIVQFDGADDLLRTPKKKLKSMLPNTPIRNTPNSLIKTNSPRTPKSTAKKYEPLPLLIKSRSVKKNLSDTPKQRGLSRIRTVINDLDAVTIEGLKKKKADDLDKTHITCKLRPCRRKSEVMLKTYNSPYIEYEPNAHGPYLTNSPEYKTSFLKKKDDKFDCLMLSNFNPTVKIKRLSLEKNLNKFSQQQQQYSKPMVLSKIDKMSCTSVDMNHNPSLKFCPVQFTPESCKFQSQEDDLNSKAVLSKTIFNCRLKKCSSRNILSQNSPTKSSKEIELTAVNNTKPYVRKKIRDNNDPLSTHMVNQSKNHILEDNINIKYKYTNPRSISKKRKRLSLKSNNKFKDPNFSKKEKLSCLSGEIDGYDVNIDEMNKCSEKCIRPAPSKELRIVLKRCPIENRTKTKTEERTTLTKNSNKCQQISKSKKNTLGDLLNTCELSNEVLNSPRTSIDIEYDHELHSFCERSYVMDATMCSDFPDAVSETEIVLIEPKIKTESYGEVQNSYKIYGIPDIVHMHPFYSSYLDVTNKKEVGNTLLSIHGISLNHVEEFKSRISGLENFSNYRKKKVQVMKIESRNDACIKEYLSKDKIIIATPNELPPSMHDAQVWLKAKELLNKKNPDVEENGNVENSPIELQHQKVDILVNKEKVLEDADSSMVSITLTPLTPIENNEKQTGNLTPLADAKFVLPHDLKKCNKLESLQTKSSNEEEEALEQLEKVSFLNNLHNSQGSFDSSFGISHATLNNTFGFKVNLENLQQAKSDIEHNYLTTLSLEVFAPTRDDLLPNPQFDAISCILYAVENSIPSSENSDVLSKTSGLIIITDGNGLKSSDFNCIDSNLKVEEVENEMDALIQLIDVCGYWDPDIFVGYEIEMSSWGYVMERAKFLDFNISPLLSRVPTEEVLDFTDEKREKLTDLDVKTKLCGRILLDVWRLMRSEIALTSYTFENVMYHILHRRCPLHSYKTLTKWFHSPQTRWIVLEYYLERVRGTLQLLDQLDLIGRTSEMAKLIGIQFYEVLSRGSQFRVESMMLRIAKPKNLVPLSPSVQQRAHMRAPEYLPLILEPQSRFYPDPMIVLDFQSLYPSMMMAYNYCFSTCLGRVEHLGQSAPFEFGASQLCTSPKLLRQLLKNDMITISPCGIAFIKKEVREGVLPRMLKEILDTRQMVKQSMKLHRGSTALQRILHSRQLGLKLIANVTYGYTAANFSGRMPCVEIGDSVVAKGRETLERAIQLVEANENWNVKVVYGDTDSMFVLVPGRSKTEAFKIGSEIAELVTKHNPQPVKLKLEKVYQPCILQTKKRYVGYMFESPDQKEPIFEAKGIETVRRDGCPAAVKILEKTLRILFDTSDVSQVKKYICRQFTKLLSGKANIQDLLFAKEFRGLKGYKPTACVPALELTRKWTQLDPRKIPRSGERVQYIIINGPPGVPLIKLVRSPHDVLADEGLKINAIYYITKVIIPPLNRCLLLIGADVNEWFASLPRKILFNSALNSVNDVVSANGIKKSTISQYFSSTKCIVDCGRQTNQIICSVCLLDKSNSLVIVEEKISKVQRGYFSTQFICQSCCGRTNSITCTSFDCPVLYVLEMKKRKLSNINQIQNIINNLL